MACKVIRDKFGAEYIVPAHEPKPINRDIFQGDPVPEVRLWWDRGTRKEDELITIRQECQRDRADVIVMTLGQAYDALHAIMCLIKDI